VVYTLLIDCFIHSLVCRYSICWNKSGLHEVILGTTGRKQGTSAKGAMYPSTESSLCKYGKKCMLRNLLVEHIGNHHCYHIFVLLMGKSSV